MQSNRVYPNMPPVYAAKENKIILQKFLCLWSKIIQKASSTRHKFFFYEKVDFLSFRKRPNINPYVEYSWNYDFWEFYTTAS